MQSCACEQSHSYTYKSMWHYLTTKLCLMPFLAPPQDFNCFLALQT
jgi:hypothetical protein